MRKCSMMGSSKYEFNPEQFDEDIKKNKEKYKAKGKRAMEVLEDLINQDTWQQENFRIITKNLRELKERYNL